MAARYTRQQKLGTGTYCRVYRGVDNETKGAVALKLIRRNAAEDDGLPSDSVREISLLRSFNHPNIVAVIDTQRVADGVSLVLEFLDRSLRDHLTRCAAAAAPELLRSYAFQLLSAVAYLWDRGVVHCDIRPENILVHRNGILKLCGFEHARFCFKPFKWRDAGLPADCYRAPETLAGRLLCDEKVDVWSCGYVIAEILLRKVLVGGESNDEQLVGICDVIGRPADWPQFDEPAAENGLPDGEGVRADVIAAVDDDLADLLRSMLAFNPANRISASDALGHRYFDNLPQTIRDFSSGFAQIS
jgi:serine/threonine protein kinase